MFTATEKANRLKSRGCRLAWSRLVDLGSIDPGSNPGSPTSGVNFKSWQNRVFYGENLWKLVWKSRKWMLRVVSSCLQIGVKLNSPKAGSCTSSNEKGT